MASLAESTIVITGGKGFVGQHLARELKHAWPGVTIQLWDQPDVDITQAQDIRNKLATVQPAWVIHLAALAAVGESFSQQELVRQVNVEGTRNVLQAVREVSADTRVLVASSADIYGLKANDFDGEPIPELPLVDALPQSPYASSKLEMERMIEDEFADFVIRVRPFAHIGPGQRQGFVTADFASQVAAIETGMQESVIQVGNLASVRDFTDVRDVVRAYRLLLEQGELGEVYHVASGVGHSIQSILDSLIALSSLPIEVQVDPERQRPSDVPALVGDATKLQQATQWQPGITVEKSLRDILQHWRRAQ